MLRKMTEILRCPKCGEYTIKENCKCGGKAISPLPPKLREGDKWGKYRREFKKNIRQGDNRNT